MGASERQLDDAARVIERAGSAESYVRGAGNDGVSLRRLGPVRTVALEIALNHYGSGRAQGNAIGSPGSLGIVLGPVKSDKALSAAQKDSRADADGPKVRVIEKGAELP